jgi:hypothetical protein
LARELGVSPARIVTLANAERLALEAMAMGARGDHGG